ncbi:MAG: hypothetical protein GPJ54_01675 [Candidatus Heimdallarchaeota archaeon]|nr:hypothetical protein [Candidatus Heimdallarchaeota archaeon]
MKPLSYYLNFIKFPWEYSEQEINYLSQLSHEEIKIEIRSVKEFLKRIRSLDSVKRETEITTEYNFFEASEFNYKINKILHKNIGYEELIAKDYFFWRFQTISRREILDYESEEIVSYINFEIDLWDEFKIKRLVPEMFKELGEIIDLAKIKRVHINARSVTEGISEDLLKYTPNVEYFRLEFMENIEIPKSLLDQIQF